MKITSFTGEYSFLSNFYPAPVTYMGQTYANSEAAFQAQKSSFVVERRRFSIYHMHDPAEAKRKGRKISLRPDWDKVRTNFMYEICMSKFLQNPDLRDALIATGDAVLEEGNSWGDIYWGKVNGRGTNMLGQILMDIREKLKWSMAMEY